MKKINSLFEIVKYNGVAPFALSPVKPLVIYKNLIWLYSYLAYATGSTIVAFFCMDSAPYMLMCVAFHIMFLTDFFIMKRGGFFVSRHFFIFTIYSCIFTICYFFGKASYSFIYYFAFIPTAFNIFTFRINRWLVIFYTGLIPLILVLMETFLYPYQQLPNWAKEVQLVATFVNILIGVFLTAIYSGYVIHKITQKQNQLISLSGSLQITLDNASGPIWSVNNKYELIVFNKQFVVFLDKYYGIQNVSVGLSLKPFLYHPNMNQQLRNQYINVLAGKSVFDEVIFDKFSFEIKAEPLFDKKGRVVGGTFSTRNLTAIKAAQHILVKAKQDAELNAESRSALLSNMSHELRTPLNGINGLIKTIQDEQDIIVVKENLKIVDGLSNHMISLINNILDFNKLSLGKITLDISRFNLAELLAQLKPLFSGLAVAKNISFVLETNSHIDVFVKGDQVKLKQVLINLVGNAIKFTHTGSVSLIVDLPEERAVCKVKFTVKDTGIGIPEKSITKIFESFTQADSKTTRKYGGSGLGLNISAGLLKVMHSSLEVKSELNIGSAFSFTLQFPKSASGQGKSIEENRREQENSRLVDLPDLNILMAEDNKINQMVAKRMLESWKVNVAIASNGVEALAMAQRENYDLILMDLDMPELDGYGATESIRSFNLDIPIVALTAASFENMDAILQLKGFTAVLQKPFMPKDLHELIRQVAHK